MNGDDLKTKENILNAAKAEFLAKGFMGASLRSIVKSAGVTTGAFYGYYKSKEALFDDLVNEQESYFLARFNEAQDAFAELPHEEQSSHVSEISGRCIDHLLEYMYEHTDEFKLLLCCSEGTKHSDFIHRLVEIEINATHRFMDVLRSLGHEIPHIDPQLEHMLVSGMFSALFETIIHDMPKEEAPGFVHTLKEFYTAGWMKIMGL